MNRIVWCLVVLATLTAGATEGWRRLPRECEFPFPTNTLWAAEWANGTDGFIIERHEGAEGSLCMTPSGLRIAKTNALGYLVVRPERPFVARDGQNLQAIADVTDACGDVEGAYQFLRLTDSRRLLSRTSVPAFNDYVHHAPSDTHAVNTPIGGTLRKFADNAVRLGDTKQENVLVETNVVPVVVLAGEASSLTIVRWCVADRDAEMRRWSVYCGELSQKWRETRNYETNVVSREAVLASLANERDHTAAIVTRNGRSHFELDGIDTPLVAYKDVAMPKYNCGLRMAASGVTLQALTLPFGGRLDLPNRLTLWTTNGFDAAAGVAALEMALRRSPEAKFILSLAVNPPTNYGEKHPDEIWRNEAGGIVYGSGCHVYQRKDAATNPRCWPWISMYSRVWREEAKACITELIAALKASGYWKRVVGVHISGFHDGQFAPTVLDYSEPAQAAFRDFLSRRYGTAAALSEAWRTNVASFAEVMIPHKAEYGGYYKGKDFFSPQTDRRFLDYNAFHRTVPFEVQADICRHVKSCAGKPIVTAKWCMSAFGGVPEAEYDFTAFVNSDGIDILIAQAYYNYRSPAVAMPEFRVTDSFHLHGKMYMNELDYPTYLTGGFPKGEANAIGRGWVPDFGAWETMNRKAAGQMFARGQGFWYYDMHAAAYDDDRQLADIARMMATAREGAARCDSPWRPLAAVVVDEEGMLIRNFVGRWLSDEPLAVKQQVLRLGYSGVPFDVLLAEDLLRDPQLAAKYGTFVFLGMNFLDERRRQLVAALSQSAHTLVFTGGAGHLFGAKEAFGFEVMTTERPAVHAVRAEQGYTQAEVRTALDETMMGMLLGVKGGWRQEHHRTIRFSPKTTPDMKIIARYEQDNSPAIVERTIGSARLVYLSEIAGLSPTLFHRLVSEAGGYAALPSGVAQVEMNGNFVCVHAMRNGSWSFVLPFAAEVTNLKSGHREQVASDGRSLPLTMEAGETCWFELANR